jgi:hypothetical protein
MATPTRGATKYGPSTEGAVTNFRGLSNEEYQQLQDLTGHGLAKKTWSNYKTAERLLAMCCKEKGIPLELPVSEQTVIVFVLWLSFSRNVCAATINNYLSGIRQLHINKGADTKHIRSDIVHLILKGKKNKETARKRETNIQQRQPVTPDILRLIKARLADSDLAGTDQRLVWSVCTCIFFGAFRSCELLCRHKDKFDPAYTLCAQDFTITQSASGERTLQFRIKAPKEDRLGKTSIVDIYESKSDICPVRAFTKWQERQPPCQHGQPLFRWSTGEPLTGAQLNQILKERLAGFIDGAETLFTSHSFRTGAASMMGNLGYSDTDIMAMGRWSSRAFESYLRLPRTKRLAVAKGFSKNVGYQ